MFIQDLHKQDIKRKDIKNFDKWYELNKKDIDTIFNSLLFSVENNDIILNTKYEQIYRKFCIFVFNNSNTSI